MHNGHQFYFKQSLKVEYDGKITFGPDDRSIQSISDGGYLRIEKTTFGNSRELLINSSGNSLNYEYKEGGRIKPFEPDGRTWLADMLPEIFRSTTLAAESRVDRFYSQGGVRRVIQEVGEMKSDHVKAKYLELLLAKDANQNEINQILVTVGEQVKSDHYQYEIFRKNQETLFSNPVNQSQYLKTVQLIGSDHYKSLLLKEVVKRQPAKAQQQQVIDLIGTIGSDHY